MVAVLLFAMGLSSVAAAQEFSALQKQAPSVVNVVALMVEFQPDTTRFTTGNGTFSGPLFPGVEAPRLDRLPHDAAYFSAHLAFLENYIDKVSDGRTKVQSYVLPEVVRVSQKMGAYSPTGVNADSDVELRKLGNLVEEAWTLAQQRGFPLPAGITSENTAFVLFHAGVGRDIELIGTTLDKTPEDLPSLFLSQDALSRLGVSPVQVDGVTVRHSLIIPRTESRLGYDFLADEPFLVELSINGLIAASFLNYLGVPDLFNTQTGESAVGPFDVMDALGIFAFGGLFPPEPSAWTKSFLGWADVTSYRDAQDVDASLTYTGHSTLSEAVRVEISDAEYFLVENRHRDPENDGVHLKVWRNGSIEDVHYPNADQGFNDVTISGFEGGVVVDVDQFDFALPGGEDEFGNPLVGGLLIWHVDENRILSSIGANRVNVDPNARGLDLEEADSAQDIGFPSNGGFFGPQFELGSPFDFWFESNPVKVRTSTGQDLRLYTNQFGPNSHPSSDANNGSKTPILISNISDPGIEMTFRLDQRTEQEWNVAERHPLDVSDNFAQTPADLALIGQIPASNGTEATTFVFGAETSLSYQIQTEEWTVGGLSAVRPVAGPFGIVALGPVGFVWVNADGHRVEIPFSGGTPATATSNIAWYREGAQFSFRMGVRVGQTFQIAHATVQLDGSFQTSLEPVVEEVRHIFQRSRTSSAGILIQGNQVVDEIAVSASPQGVALPNGATSGVRFADGAIGATDWMISWTEPASKQLWILKSSGESFSTSLDGHGDCTPSKAVFGLVTTDSEVDVIVSCGEYVYGFHNNGVLIAGFPSPIDGKAISQPIMASSGDQKRVLFFQTDSGNLDAIGVGSGVSRVDGFPLSTGLPAAFAPIIQETGLITVSGRGPVTTWTSVANQGWSARQSMDYDLAVSYADEAQSPPLSGQRLLSGEETYNWPNPISEGLTHIRFMVSSDSMVDVTIIDGVGGLVEQFDVVSARANLPTEIIWNTSTESGLYIARVTARSTDGKKTDSRLIKMAVIR